MHLWNSFSEKYYQNIQNFNYIFTNNSLYSSLLKNIYNIIYENYQNHEKNNKITYNLNEYIFDKNNNKIYNISIIIIYKNKFIQKCRTIIDSILYQEGLYLLNIELVIIDNNENNFLDYYNKEKDLKNNIINKNINIKIIRLNNNYNEGIMLNIGINYCSNELVTFIDYQNIMSHNRLILQALKYNELNNNTKILYNKTFDDEKLININSRESIINIFQNNNIYYNINNIIFNKKKVNIYFPNKYKNIEEMTILFIILNILNNNFIICDENIINYYDSYKDKDNNFKYLIDEITYNNIILNTINSDYFNKIIIEDIIKKYYDNNINYLEYIENIFNI